MKNKYYLYSFLFILFITITFIIIAPHKIIFFLCNFLYASSYMGYIRYLQYKNKINILNMTIGYIVMLFSTVITGLLL